MADQENKFEKAFNKLEDRIQFMVDKDKLSDKQMEFYNNVLSGLKEANEEQEGMIFDLQVQLHNKELELEKERRLHEGRIFKMEAIALMHGIIDINSWVNKPAQWCADEVVISKQTGSFILPAAFRDKNMNNLWKQLNNRGN